MTSHKIGIFSDSHYCHTERIGRTRRPKLSYQKVREAMEAFKREETELCICMGDLTDVSETVEEAKECLAEITELIASYKIPVYFVPGNHDYSSYSAEYFSAATGSPIPPYIFESSIYRFIALDANYRSNMQRYDIAGVEWTDSNIPSEQAEYLKNAISASEKPCIVLVHECLDSAVDINHIVKNADEIRAVIEAGGKVKYVIQGHYHLGYESTINGIEYITMPAMCEGDENSFRILSI